MRCVLLFNPAAGRNRQKRKAVVERVADALRREGHSAEVIETKQPGAAPGTTGDALTQPDAVFACGGDGTVHEVMQGLVCDGREPAAALGIVPLGSANVLARHLRLPLNPVAAASLQMRGEPRTIPVGKVRGENGERYFVVMAGAGPGGALAHDMPSGSKSQMGRLAYYTHAARLFLSRRFEPFEVEWTEKADGVVFRQRAISVMAVRVGNLGGIFSGLTDPGATIQDEAFKLHILSPPGWLGLPLWFLLGWLRAARLNPFLRIVDSTSFSCRPTGAAPVYVQVDGECFGTLPFDASVVPHSLRVMMPNRSLQTD